MEEDLEHFLVRCPELEVKRNRKIMKNELRMTSGERTLHILFKDKQHNEVGRMIRSMWNYRKHRRDKMKPP